MKFEKMAEIKAAFKNMDQEDEEKVKWRDAEIQKIKDETETEKQRLIKAAQLTLETEKAQLKVEKAQALKQVKEDVRQGIQKGKFDEVRVVNVVDSIKPVPKASNCGKRAPLGLQKRQTGDKQENTGHKTPAAGQFHALCEPVDSDPTRTGHFKLDIINDGQGGQQEACAEFNPDTTPAFASSKDARQRPTHSEELQQMKEKLTKELEMMQTNEDEQNA